MVKLSDKLFIYAGIFVLAMPYLFHKIAIQPTGSLAKGIYIKSGIESGEKLGSGDIVWASFKRERLLKRPDTYPLPENLPWHSFIKVVAAVPGDTINISDNGVFINAKFHGPVYKRDSQGRPITRVMTGKYQLRNGWYFVTTPHPKSYDSRYYGPVHISQMQSATPLFLLSSNNLEKYKEEQKNGSGE